MLSLSYFVCNQIWLNPLTDDRHYRWLRSNHVHLHCFLQMPYIKLRKKAVIGTAGALSYTQTSFTLVMCTFFARCSFTVCPVAPCLWFAKTVTLVQYIPQRLAIGYLAAQLITGECLHLNYLCAGHIICLELNSICVSQAFCDLSIQQVGVDKIWSWVPKISLFFLLKK